MTTCSTGLNVMERNEKTTIASTISEKGAREMEPASGEKNIKVLFVTNCSSTFVHSDLELLRRNFDVRVVNSEVIAKNPLVTLRTLFAFLTGALWADVTFSWFGNLHAFLAVALSRILGKRSIVVMGGFEVAKLPDMKYGASLNPITAYMVGYILRKSDKVLMVDDSLRTDAMANYGVDGGNIETSPTCHDGDVFRPGRKKEKIVLTVAFASPGNVKRKGVDVFARASRYLPDIKFVLVGGSPSDSTTKSLIQEAGGNFIVLPAVAPNELVEHYQRAMVYCQLSLHEGLPSALCEAMLCECVPVGTCKNGIPTAIGDVGYYVPYGDPKATSEAIVKALGCGRGADARERIISMFPKARRERELVRAIQDLWS